MKKESTAGSRLQNVQTPNPKALIFGDILNVTWRMLAATLLGLGLGYGVDYLLNSSPLGFLIGSGLGLLAGIGASLRLLKSVKGVE